MRHLLCLSVISLGLGCGDTSLTKYGPECGEGTRQEGGICVPDDVDTGSPSTTGATAGDTTGGDTTGGDTTGGDTTGGDTTGGDTTGGDTTGTEDTGTVDTGSTTGAEETGSPDTGDSTGDDSIGETDVGETDGGETDGGETDGGETDGGETTSGDTTSGDTTGGETGETDGGSGPVDADGDGIFSDTDCDDGDPAIGGPSTWWLDADTDGHGSADSPYTGCDRPSDAYVSTSDDCDDGDATVWDFCPADICGGPGPGLSSYTSPEAYSPEIHIVSVYEPHPIDSAILIENKRPNITLVVSSYRTANWIVENVEGGSVSAIAITGHGRASHTVTGDGATGVPTTVETFSACSYEWPTTAAGTWIPGTEVSVGSGDGYDWYEGGCSTPGLVDNVMTHYGTTIQSWQGCYGGNHFVVE